MNWTDQVSLEEVEYTLACADCMATVPHAQKLLHNRSVKQALACMRQGMIDKKAYAANPLKQSDTPFLFEVRFAYELFRRGIDFAYEFQTGVGDSSVDFKFDVFAYTFLVELGRFHVSDAVSRATSENDGISTLILRSGAPDKATEEHEMLTAQDKLLRKCYDRRRGIPIKFPTPCSHTYHVIMVDARGYLGLGSGNECDWMQIANGSAGLLPARVHMDPNNGTPLRGLFEAEYPYNPDAAQVFRDRIHLIGFAIEKEFHVGEIQEVTKHTANPLLFKSQEYDTMWRHWALS